MEDEEMRTRRRTNNEKEKLTTSNYSFLVIGSRSGPFSRIRTLKSDPDPVKSHPDP